MVGSLTPHQYLNRVVTTYTVATGPGSPVANARLALAPLIRRWASQYLLAFPLSGSAAKGTAITLGTDADIFISLKHNTPGSLADIYWSLYNYLAANGITPRQQNVSVGINYAGLKIDLVPGRRQSAASFDHSLYRSKASTWTQTNVQKHVARVKNSGRTREIRALKVWRERHGPDFPSFYLELVCIRALAGRPILGNLADKVCAVLQFIANDLDQVRIVDPANSANTISNELTLAEKRAIMAQAAASLAEPYWENIIW
jgi:hypothetical protein